ncbi:MAG: phosphotransferase [Nanoarchaeota archaeon]|nr:phosphotransferase [Nanoarchaeota archaeon]MBU0977634.1 phosphotransferase [Nanoarchaeota archaeon]
MRNSLIKKELGNIGLDVLSVNFMDVGTAKNNYVIKTDGEKYVLKLFTVDKRKKIQKLIKMLRKINEREELVVSPIHDKVLDFGSMIGFVYRFVDGKHYREIKIGKKIFLFGKIVGKFNRLAKNILPKGRNCEYVGRINKEVKATVRYLKGQKSLLHKKARALLDAGSKIVDKEYNHYKFRTQLIHGDLHYNNVFCFRRKFIILDVDGLENSILAREVSTLASYMVQRSISDYKKDLEEFFSGYESEYKLFKKEKELIPVLMIIRKFGEILYLLSQEKKGILSEKEIKHFLGHTTRKLGLIINNFDKIKKIFSEI